MNRFTATGAAASIVEVPERRRSQRRDHIIEAYVSSPTATPLDPHIEATSVNLSRHGVGFETLTPLPINSYFNLQIGYDDQTIVTEVRVVSCSKTDHGNYYIGAEFH
jgi:hypothetical protein